MSLDRHTRRISVFRKQIKCNKKTGTNEYIKEYINDEPLDIDNMKEIECYKCLTVYNIDDNKICPYCEELEKYYSQESNDFMSYIEKKHRKNSLWQTAYEKPTLKYLIDNCWYCPFQINLKEGLSIYDLDSLTKKKFESSRVYLNSEIIYYGYYYQWFREEIFYDNEKYEELENNKTIISEFKENLDNSSLINENESDDSTYEENFSDYLYIHHKDKYYYKKYLPFRKVLCVGYNCDMCQEKSTYTVNNITYFNVFLTSRNENSILECYDYCSCIGTRIKNYDYCQKCFFEFPLQKAKRKLLLVKIFKQYLVYDNDFLSYLSNMIKNFD